MNQLRDRLAAVNPVPDLSCYSREQITATVSMILSEAAQADGTLTEHNTDQEVRSPNAATSGPSTPAPSRSHRRWVLAVRGMAQSHPRRWVLAGAALVGAGALVVGPGILGGEAAFASWSATPNPVPPAEATVAGEDCRTRYLGDPTGVADRKVVDTAAIVLVERRGAWTYVVLGGAGGFEATCLLRDNGPSEEVTGGGYAGTLEPATLAPNTVVTHGTHAQSDDGSSYRDIIGRVGSDVVSVVINTRQQGPVEATVHGGYFAAWWPGPPIVGMQGPGPEPTITLVLKDGTARADIPMAQINPSHS